MFVSVQVGAPALEIGPVEDDFRDQPDRVRCETIGPFAPKRREKSRQEKHRERDFFFSSEGKRMKHCSTISCAEPPRERERRFEI